MEHAEETLPAVSGVESPRAARAFSLCVFVAAGGAGVALLVGGAALPPFAPLLVLTAVAAVCVNRFVLFPTEHAATGEAAVLLAAVVGFRADAPYLGPLLLALLVGPLDALHWEQRSYVRMAYNAGNRGLATLAAAGALAAGQSIAGTGTAAAVAVVMGACAVFAFVDLLVSVALLHLHGERMREAARHLLDVDALTLPVAGLGAVAGVLAGEVGWWATVLVVLPAAFLPELVIVRARAPLRTVRGAVVVLTASATLALVALLTPVASTAVVAITCVVALAVGIELRIDRGILVPPLVATVVAATTVVVDGDRMRTAAVLVAVAATATAWWWSDRRFGARGAAALATAAVSALLAAHVALELPRSVGGVAAGALAAGALFEVAAVMVTGGRRRRGSDVTWTVPVLAAAIAAAGAWGAWGPSAWPVVPVGLVVTAGVWVAWGAPPWRSRCVAPAAARILPRVPRRTPVVVLLVCATGAVLVACLTVLPRDGAPSVAGAWSAIALGELATAMAAAGARQWRFAPRSRVVSQVVVVVVSTALLLVGTPLLARRSLGGLAVVVAAMASVLVVARVPARRIGAETIALRTEIDA